MIEKNFLPSLFKVATFTFLSEVPLVLIILLMTGQAVCLQLFFMQIALMATGAFQFIMFPAQGVFCLLGMVEKNLFPALFHVARFAFRTKIAFMFVIFFVTGIALLRRIFEFLINMAFFTLDFGMLAQQFEISFVVVEAGGFPVFFFVAISAIFAQATFMLVILLVAGDTNGRCFTEFFRG